MLSTVKIIFLNINIMIEINQLCLWPHLVLVVPLIEIPDMILGSKETNRPRGQQELPKTLTSWIK